MTTKRDHRRRWGHTAGGGSLKLYTQHLDRVTRKLPWQPALTLATAAVALALLGCGNSDDQSTGEDDALSATVAVINKSGKHRFEGSGEIYDAERGLVLTSATVVWDFDSLEVVTRDGRRIHARLVARSPCRDLAVMELSVIPRDLKEIQFGRSASLEPGDHVTSVGVTSSRHGRFRVAETTGSVTASSVKLRLDATLPPHPGLLEHQAPVAPGAAGGPLLNDTGAMVGVNSLMASYGHNAEIPAGLSFAVNSDYAHERLAQLRPRRHAYFGGWKKDHRCHNQFTTLVRKHRGTVESERNRGGHMADDEMHHESGGNGKSKSGDKMSGKTDSK